MLPSSLKSIYKQYKADTDSVATWLGTTAMAHGYKNDSPGSHNPPNKSSRKKSKTRKAAKAKHQPQPDKSTTEIPYVIRIRDFEPMASYIANIDSVRVPDHFAIALERAFWGT
jgi:hypothetical protein